MTSSSRPPDAGGRPDPTGAEPAPTRGYLLDNARAEAGERFVWLAELFDGVTRGHLDRLGLGAGSRCWEVGAGGRGIPEALAAAVGPTGYVLATDIDRRGCGRTTGTRCAGTTSPSIRRRSRGRSIWCTPGSCWSICARQG